ncbi:type 1 glutamine amidotransferase domain-containing protein [Psychromonas sp. Urea-02u-13]|uniref:type 1 glutamine amidotransferase domain-containing protein n=1 Tax=Psychromonas sp. Urea-02u-13 TaxID=2058326 RepID=UPI000C31F7B7|nr:type 1 glutamine amidotransferase domain-containing protein [Psychromonas sp. Urea-02u-13]PKG37834.1 type 1 glutamine amidotransferase domain-containing protein [Psychromonas sp. Urea-02u-13]
MSKKILMVLTSHDQLGDTGHKTGFWVEEFAAPYYVFADAGVELTLATPKGGQAPIDPTSELADFQTEATKRFDADKTVQQLVANTEKLEDINADDYDAVFYPGGHGPLWDLTDNVTSIALIEKLLNSNKPVAAVCHATAAFLNVQNTSGEFAVQGKAVTGFTNSEEDAVQLTDVVPFLLEDELIKRGGEYQKGEDWSAFAVQDGLMISGQNPASSVLAAEKLLAHVNA